MVSIYIYLPEHLTIHHNDHHFKEAYKSSQLQRRLDAITILCAGWANFDVYIGELDNYKI